jgi:hypothetical protein
MEKLTEFVGGRRQIYHVPPLLVRLSETVLEEQEAWITEQHVEALFKEYMDLLPEEKHQLASHFRISSGPLRIIGIGSVGIRCLVLLLEGATNTDITAERGRVGGPGNLRRKKNYASHAQRVVVGQKLMQAASDIFLVGIKDPLTGI